MAIPSTVDPTTAISMPSPSCLPRSLLLIREEFTRLASGIEERFYGVLGGRLCGRRVFAVGPRHVFPPPPPLLTI